MFIPIKVLDIELSRPLETITGLDRYGTVQALVRLHGAPIGYVTLPLANGSCSATRLSKAILDRYSWAIICHLVNDGLAMPVRSDDFCLEDLLHVAHPVFQGELPRVTVAVCTRDRTTDLAQCLGSLIRLDYPELDLLVVDNAPKTDETEHLVSTRYPRVRYIREPRPGLDWARNRAILESQGEIVAYTDDDVVVDPGWVQALAEIFAEHVDVMAVTGLVIPYELETEAQMLFERYGGFGRGFQRRWYRLDRGSEKRVALLYGGSGQFGTGANMAYRRSVFDQMGLFDPALDVGTVTNGGGDLDMFFRVLKEGYTLVYEPKALVRHRHRREYSQLRTQLMNNGIGLYAYFVRSTLTYPEERFAFLRLGLWWLRYWHWGRLRRSLFHPGGFPRDLILAELYGSFLGLGRYQKAQRTVAKIAHPANLAPAAVPPLARTSRQPHREGSKAMAVRTVELRQPLEPMRDVVDYSQVLIFATWAGRLIGSVDIANHHQPISVTRLRDALVISLGLVLIEPTHHVSKNELWAKVHRVLIQHYTPSEDGGDAVSVRPQLPLEVTVSVVVATLDRPGDLHNCLCGLVAQRSPRKIEIVVVDNNPASGLTPPVVAEFPSVISVEEPRRGVAYARNAGFAASTGDIVVTTDDDVTVPPGWLEQLVAPFFRANVMVVTGNILPLELGTPAQRLFETYGGLGRGYEPWEADRDWFESSRYRAAPTWILGGTANVAFRATIFHHPEIGLMDEALGPGMPSGVGEDTYAFYKVLKAGYTIVYEPEAYVWHKHRADLPALRRQLYNYSKGHVAYHLTTLLRDHDLRGLVRLIIELPWVHFRRTKEWILGRSDYPMSLLLLEIVGNLSGPWTLWRSRRRVKREGCSGPYIPVSQRAAIAGELPWIIKNTRRSRS